MEKVQEWDIIDISCVDMQRTKVTYDLIRKILMLDQEF